MTEVLTISTQPEGSFGSSNVLRRSTSQTSFLNQASYSRPPSNVRASAYSHIGYDIRLPVSVPSSAPSSPRLSHPDFSNQPSYTSTPSSSLSLDECSENDENDDDIIFPSYDDSQPINGPRSPPPTPENTQSDEDSVPISTSPTTISRLPPILPPDTQPLGGDDTAIRREPSRHVDYLSHNWREEDIWSSWRHIVAKRNVYSNSSRLENASWRSWTKSKYRLRTVSPETLNWMKDHDVTWLYGPLQPGNTRIFDASSSPPTSALSRTNSFATKKPILKKRSLSEIMLQRSLSSSTLMKQATDALRAQGPNPPLHIRPVLASRTYSDLPTASSPLTPSDGLSSALASSSSSGAQTPSERRHIHFNDKVEQCIAINKESDDHYDDDDDDNSALYSLSSSDDQDDDDDDGIIMMKPVHAKERKLSSRSPPTPRGSFSSSSESKTIAMLPSTTLKYRNDPPDALSSSSSSTSSASSSSSTTSSSSAPTKRTAAGGIWNAAARLVTSPSQETIRPAKSSSNFLLDDDEGGDAAFGWLPASSSSSSSSPCASSAARRDSIFHPSSSSSGSGSGSGTGSGYRYRVHDDGDGDDGGEAEGDVEGRGLRRTPSGMFMPYEEDEDDVVAAGLFGRVVDTVNTAKDIAHVIWNVGWRR